MSKTVMADSLTKDGRFFTNHVLEQMNGKTRKKNSGGGKTRKKNSRGRISKAQKKKDTSLFHAIGNHDYDEVENALYNGANVNARNKDGDTPLICAITSDNIIYDTKYDVIELLLENGADVTNEEQSLAEDLEEDDQDQSGIPYLIEYYIEIKKKKDDLLLKQNIVAQTIPIESTPSPLHMESRSIQQDRETQLRQEIEILKNKLQQKKNTQQPSWAEICSEYSQDDQSYDSENEDKYAQIIPYTSEQEKQNQLPAWT